MNIILIILIAVFLYSLLAIALKVPSFATSRAFKQNDQKTGLLNEVLDKFTVKLTPKIKLLVMKKSKIEKLLAVANDPRSPEELVAKAYVNAVASLTLIPFLLMIEPLFCTFALLLAFYSYRREFNLVKEEGEKRQRNIENEMLKFVIYMANALKTQKNVITCIESYKMNFDTPLTEELTLTLADMKIGNYEDDENLQGNTSTGRSFEIDNLMVYFETENTMDAMVMFTLKRPVVVGSFEFDGLDTNIMVYGKLESLM